MTQARVGTFLASTGRLRLNNELPDSAETSGLLKLRQPAASVCPSGAHSHLSSPNLEGEKLLEMIFDLNAHYRESIKWLCKA